MPQTELGPPFLFSPWETRQGLLPATLMSQVFPSELRQMYLRWEQPQPYLPSMPDLESDPAQT